MDDSESYDNVVDWLSGHGITDEDPSVACAKLLEQVFLDIINGTDVEKCHLGILIHLSVNNRRKPTERLLQRHIYAWIGGELFGHVHRLGQKALYFPGPHDRCPGAFLHG